MTLEKALQYVEHDKDVIYMTNSEKCREFCESRSKEKWNKMIIFRCRKKELMKSDIYDSIKNIEIQIDILPFGYMCVDVDNKLNSIENIKNHICTYSC